MPVLAEWRYGRAHVYGPVTRRLSEAAMFVAIDVEASTNHGPLDSLAVWNDHDCVEVNVE